MNMSFMKKILMKEPISLKIGQSLSGTTDDEVSVKEGALEINGRGDNSNGTGVLLPEYLGLFGNYKIEADMTHLAANNSWPLEFDHVSCPK